MPRPDPEWEASSGEDWTVEKDQKGLGGQGGQAKKDKQVAQVAKKKAKAKSQPPKETSKEMDVTDVAPEDGQIDPVKTPVKPPNRTWSEDVPVTFWKDPKVVMKGTAATAEQVQRALGTDEACRGELHQLLSGKHGLDQAWARSWVEALMMPGETSVLELHCVAFNGMPQIHGVIDCFGGSGLLIFSRLDDSRHRLHFLFQEGQQELSVSEEAKIKKETHQDESGAKSQESAIALKVHHTSVYNMVHRTIALEVENTILLAQTEMKNRASLAFNFDSTLEHVEEFKDEKLTKTTEVKCCLDGLFNCLSCPNCPSCPKCPKCPQCPQCPSWWSCCRWFSCTCWSVSHSESRSIHEVTLVGDAVSVTVNYKKPFPQREEVHDKKQVTLPFRKTNFEGQAESTSVGAQMNLLSILYRMPMSTLPCKFTAWVDPCHSVKHTARFAHELSAISAAARPNFQREGDPFEPGPLGSEFAKQFRMFEANSMQTSSTKPSPQSGSSGLMKSESTANFPLKLPMWMILCGALALLVVVVVFAAVPESRLIIPVILVMILALVGLVFFLRKRKSRSLDRE